MIWKGPLLDATGYGNASREYALSLDRLGLDVKIETYTWNFPFSFQDQVKRERLQSLIDKKYAENKRRLFICHSPPAIIDAKEKKKFDRSILNTVWETNIIPEDWVPIINTFDAVCVPCTPNLQAMKSSGITAPLFLAPHGADPLNFHPNNKPLSLSESEGKFVFVSIFDFQHRKNPETLLRAYWEEFTDEDPVLLVVKTYGSSRKQIRTAIMNYKKRLGFGNETAPLYVMAGISEEKTIKGIYTLGNVFVLPTRGEGVGLPYIEALCSGTPVIATGWGGQMDFLNDQNSFLVNYQLHHPSISMYGKHAISTIYRNFDGKGQLWAEADLNHLKKQMRTAFESPEICKQKGKQGRKDMLKMTWDQAGIALKRAAEKVISY
ncbi:glycosyltransferase [Bacillus sp. NEB1478]|uniref:glycosyltransferase n=1 Tax=Bacillus sp. NEB1478 TaxID=3073816 RepID=UPI00287324D9|nr:glycosyltransferase [Bacillus sp. NEB1478]WNB91064.1 glycosyltransferase [Bacillus sp. NEB1478]